MCPRISVFRRDKIYVKPLNIFVCGMSKITLFWFKTEEYLVKRTRLFPLQS